jgi:predicted Zn-dependent protease with MMP-like domain
MTPDLDHFERIARATIDDLPPPFRDLAAQVQLRVADWPDARMVRDLGLRDRRDLTGLYEGIPMTHKSHFDPGPEPDRVWIFREPILLEHRARGDEDLDTLIAHVVIHEFAHHFGWSDDEIAAVAPWDY